MQNFRFKSLICISINLISWIIPAYSLDERITGELYQVHASSSLRVRCSPGLSENVIGHLDNGEVVSVYSIENGWARIDYKEETGYVSSKYLVKYSPPEQHKIEEDTGAIFKFLRRNISDKFMYVAIALAILTYVLNKNNENHIAIMVSYLLMTVSQLIYTSGYFGEKPLPPFYDPSQIGWIWAIIGFICFVIFVGFQIYMLFEITDKIADKTGCYIDLKVGLWGWLIGFTYLMINGIFFDFRNAKYPIITMAVFQVLQVILSFRHNFRFFLLLTFYNIIYLLSVFAITLSSINILSILIVIGIFYLAISSLFSERPRCCGWCRSYSNGYCYYRNRSVDQNSVCSKFER